MQQKYIGRGSLGKLVKILDQYNLKNLFVVTGRDSYASSGVKDILEPMLSGLCSKRFNQYSSNPKLDEVMAGVKCFRSDSFDCILAIGGGSAIDVAKSINALSGHVGEELDIVTGAANLTKPLVPLIAVPTTAGTGSEATHFAVIYNGGKKYSLASNVLLPSVAIVDAALTDKLPKDVTAHSGFDALCQAVESYWAKGGTAESRVYAKQAISILVKSLPDVVNKPGPISRDSVMVAANLAGRAINISKTTAPHALSYGITAKYGLAHGYAAALTLGAFFQLHQQLLDAPREFEESQELYASSLKQRSIDLFKLFKVDNADQAMRFWYQFMQRCGLEVDFAKLGIYKDELADIVDAVNTERLNNHPIKLNSESLLELMNKLANGSHIKVS